MNGSKESLIEALADIEHQRWSDWQQYLQNQCCDDEVREGEYTGALVIPADKALHWQKLIATPYEALSEYSKQSDRDQVMRYLPFVIDFVADWIEDQEDHLWVDAMARRWREALA